MLTDGVVRDRDRLAKVGLPVFARGMRPPDAMGRNDVDTMDTPIRMMGVEIKPGDFIVADADGIVVVPREMTAEVLELAINKAGTENKVRDLLRLGHTLGEAWVRYGVL
jgi:regulator of RNase E activity RraA